jgi:hypothetical protein
MSEYYLPILGRPVAASNGNPGWELQTIHAADVCGIAVYVSALDAEISRAHRIANGEKSWRRFGLEELNVLEAAGGEDVLRTCMIFGFCATGDGRYKLQRNNCSPCITC